MQVFCAKKVFANTNFYQILVFIDAKIGTNHGFVFQKVFTNTIFYQILVFGDTNIFIKIIFGLFLGIFWTKLPNIQIRLPTTASLIFGWHSGG